MTDGLPEAGGQEQSCPPVSTSMRVVLCTFPDLEKAREVGGEIVGKKLAACVNLLPGVESIYRWEGKVQNEPEVLAIFKLAAETYAEFEQELIRLHPYDVPEIVALSPEKVATGYLEWVLAQSRGA